MRSAPASRLTGLEVLRFLAALAVLVWHYQHFMFVGGIKTPYEVTQSPFYGLLAPFYLYGYAGVQLFWCLSGFIFTWKYEHSIATRRVGGWRFAVRRFSRLYPLHLAMLLCVALLQPRYAALHGGRYFVYYFNDAYHFVLNLFFAAYWGFQSGYSFDGPVWSVSLEVLVYVGFFLLCRFGRGGWRQDAAVLVLAALAGALARPVLGEKLPLSGAVMFFYIGALVARLHAWLHQAPPVHTRRAGIVAMAVAAGAVGLIAGHWLRIAGASLALFPALTLLCALWQIRTSRAARLAVFLGNLTYASYLLHFPMQLSTVLILTHLHIAPSALFFHRSFFAAYLIAVLIAAALTYRWFEAPAQDWLRARLDGRGGANAV